MKKIISFLFVVAALAACTDDEWPAQPDWSKIPDPSIPVDDGLKRPAACSNRIVAHRGGAAEAGVPDNSIAALEYAMSLGCYGSECDIYWTADDRVVVAHADGNCKINGLAPWEHTLDELRTAGRLANGEQLPSLEEYIDRVMADGSCTKLVLDVKRIDKPFKQAQYVINAARRACEIAIEKNARHFVEIICTGSDSEAMKWANSYAELAELPIGMNWGHPAADYSSKGYKWANLSARGQMNAAAGGLGERSIDEFETSGVALSVYNVDRQAGDGNAVYAEAAVDWYVGNIDRFRTVCTNYPAWLLRKVKTYDGIRSRADFDDFRASLASDPTGRRFADASGAVVLHCDLTLEAFEPLGEFTGLFDGGGHTITLDYSGAATKIGLFERLGGTVRNLTVAGSFVSTRTDDKEVHLGAVAAETDAAAIENCTNKARITVDNPADAASRTMVLGGMAGKAWNGVSICDCRNEGDIVFSSPAVYMIGGMVGALQEDAGVCTIRNCSNSGRIDNTGTSTAWNFMGGMAGKTISERLDPGEKGDYRLVVEGCVCSSAITVGKGSKVRVAGIVAQTQGAYRIAGCTFSGRISNTDAAARDVVAGGMVAMADKECVGLVSECTFDGSIESTVAGPNIYFGGVYGNNGGAATVVDGCKTTANARVDAPAGKSVGMLAGRPNKSGFTIRNCRIAGAVTDNKGARIVIAADNIEEWMYKGYGTSAKVSVVLENNGFNDEK